MTDRQCPRCKSTHVVGWYENGYYWYRCFTCRHEERFLSMAEAAEAWGIPDEPA